MTGRIAERVLVIGDDMRIFLAVVRSLGRVGKEVHAAPFNFHSPALKSKYISEIYQFPRYSDDPTAWARSLSHCLRTYSFDLVIPCCDRAILPLYMHRAEFSNCRLAIPNTAAMELLFDKELTRQLAQDLQIPVVPGGLLTAQDSAAGLAARFGLPLVVKARRSYWSDRLDVVGKVWIIESELELQAVLEGISEPSRFLIEGFFAGVGVGISVLARDGEILQAFQHRRLREGRGGSSSYRVSEAINPELYDACRKILRRVGLTGVCMFEFRYNPADRSWILLETNARFWGSSPLPLSLGVDFPRLLYDLLVYEIARPAIEYPAGIRGRNLTLDGYNLLGGLRHLRKDQIGSWIASLWDFGLQPLRWLTGRERSDSFVIDDLRPAVWELAVLARTLSQKLVRHRQQQPRRRASDQAAQAKFLQSQRAQPPA